MAKEKEVRSSERINKEFTELLHIVEVLRQPNGCPWDMAQTRQSLLPYLLQEAHELLEAVIKGGEKEICEELGDVLLQVVLHGQIAKEEGLFDVADICKGIKDKLIKRHPHVFSTDRLTDVDKVKTNWEAIKREEKKDNISLLDRVSRNQPALLEGTELQRRARTIGFDWPNHKGALLKVEEEIEELKEAISQEPHNIEEEIGDLLFATVNLARFFEIDGEIAMKRANEKFRKRFAAIEKKLEEKGLKGENVSLEELDLIWDECKREETI